VGDLDGGIQDLLLGRQLIADGGEHPLRLPPFGDVSCHLRRADDAPLGVPDR
jgi:hypothetical protein